MRSVASARISARIAHRLALVPCRPPHYQSTAFSACSASRASASASPSAATRESSFSASMSLLPQHMAGFMLRVAECNTGLEQLPQLTPLVIEGQTVGKLKEG